MGFDKYNPNEDGYAGKVALRIIQLLISSACIGAAGYSNGYSLPLLVGIIVSWLWTLANIIKRFSSAYPMHPGANVAMELLLWQTVAILAGVVAVRALAVLTVSAANSAIQSACNGSNNCWTTSNIGPLDKTSTAAIVAIATGCVVSLLHFILFVWACVDTHRLRRSRREAVFAQQLKQSQYSVQPSQYSTVQSQYSTPQPQYTGA